MYLKLNRDCRLRGYKGLPYCVVSPYSDTPLKYLSEEEFELFRLADGETEIDLAEDLSERQQLMYLANVGAGYFIECGEPSPIDDAQRYLCYPNAYIHGVYWSITGDCNLRCRHCYMHGGRNKYRELGRDELFGLIRQFDECGVMQVELSGGEPYVSPYFWDIVDEIKRRGMYIEYLHTNGLLLDDDFYEKSAKRDMHWIIDISFDGVGTHDYLRATEGMEAQTVAALRKVKENGLPLRVISKFHQGSVHAVMDTYRLVRDIGADAWKISMVVPIGEATSHIKSAPAVCCDEYIDMLRQYRADGNPFRLFFMEGVVQGASGGGFSFWENECGGGDFEKRLSCAKARKRPYVLPDGTLLPCIGFSSSYQEQFMPNLLNTPLGEIYCSADSVFRRLVDIKACEVIEHNEECIKCEYRLKCCGGCRADAADTHPGIDAAYGRGMMLCSAYKSGFMEKLKQACIG